MERKTGTASMDEKEALRLKGRNKQTLIKIASKVLVASRHIPA